MTAENGCELCEAAVMTERFFEDDECWIAECEACAVPMVVWKTHDPSPHDEVKNRLHGLLLEVSVRFYDFEPRIDDNMRTIPGHYHAHARPRNGLTGYGTRKTDEPLPASDN